VGILTEYTREIENICRASTFGDFVTILTERSMQDVMVARSPVIFTAIAITKKIVQCYCVHRVVYTVQFPSKRVIPANITKGESALYSSYLDTLEQ
jgi:hypothetical protein